MTTPQLKELFLPRKTLADSSEHRQQQQQQINQNVANVCTKHSIEATRYTFE